MTDNGSEILFIEDDKIDRMAFLRFVEKENLPYNCTVASSISEARSELSSKPFDVIVSDYSLADGTALDVLGIAKTIPVIVVTGVSDEEAAIHVWKGGAYDYVTKDIQRNYLKSIPKTIDNAINFKKIHEALNKKEKDLEAIFDASPVGMLLIDRNMVITRVNLAVKRMVKKEYQHIINRQIGCALDCVNTIGTENGKICGIRTTCADCLFRRTIHSVLDSGNSVRDCEICPTFQVDHREFTPCFSMCAEPVDIDGCRYVLVALSDITERRKAEYERELAEAKLKKMIDMKSGFISIVAHELRTSLAAIKESVSIVFDGMAGQLNKKQKEFLGIAKRNTDRLSSLINDVLDFQKLETNRMDLNLQNVDMNEVASEVHETMSLCAKKRGVKLLLERDKNLPEAHVDRVKIIQVLTNIVHNAIKFTPEKGGVTIRVNHQDEEVLMSVTDTGIGIPKEALPKIFECFYCATQRNKKIQGTGLGLAIVQKIVMMHNGRVDVLSEEGRGTTFTILLPMNFRHKSDCTPLPADDVLEYSISN
jgi:nitrogen-specific signal transduction histidine kinase/DNA-binding NarL/FixJ family response regulator